MTSTEVNFHEFAEKISMSLQGHVTRMAGNDGERHLSGVQEKPNVTNIFILI